MTIRRLTPHDATAWQALRLAALRDSPSAFGMSHEEECDTPIATIAQRLAPDEDRDMFGAFAGDVLVGMVRVGRETVRKQRHKGYIRGMYVAPEHRGKGLARQLMLEAIACAESMPGLRQLDLSVTAGNASAHGLYLSLGFVQYGCERDSLFTGGAYYDEIYMVRPIGPR